MTVRVLTGSKQEIAREVLGIDGDVREAIILVEEPTFAVGSVKPAAREIRSAADLFATMEQCTVEVDDFDDSREAIYSREAE